MIDLEKAKEIILHRVNTEAIILFGSYARNTQTEDSDVDLAIKCKENISKLEWLNLKRELEDILKKEVDLINLSEIGDGIKYEILINGEAIYVEDEYKFELYKLRKYKEYLELNESRELIIQNMKNGGSAYGE